MGSLWGHVVSERLGFFWVFLVSSNGMLGFMCGPWAVSVLLVSLAKCWSFLLGPTCSYSHRQARTAWATTPDWKGWKDAISITHILTWGVPEWQGECFMHWRQGWKDATFTIHLITWCVPEGLKECLMHDESQHFFVIFLLIAVFIALWNRNDWYFSCRFSLRSLS